MKEDDEAEGELEDQNQRKTNAKKDRGCFSRYTDPRISLQSCHTSSNLLCNCIRLAILAVSVQFSTPLATGPHLLSLLVSTFV